MKQLNKALFIDLDGTIIKTKSGNTFPIDIYDWEFNTGVLTKLKHYSNENYVICIVTNQGGIEMGHITDEEFQNKISVIIQEIEDYIRTGISAVYCPSMNGYHRKPMPGMAYKLAIELHLDLKNSIMVGDREEDKGFAEMAQIGTFVHVNDFTGNYK